MTTGQRMKNRRKAIGLSAEKVADILGVSPATIYRYENGDIEKVPGDRLGPIADALQTTPAYLMGWDESPEKSSSTSRQTLNIISISPEDEELLRKFHCLDDRGQAAVLNVLNHEYESLPGEKTRTIAKEA